MEGIYKVYSGKAGHCMCGCAGDYTYTKFGAENYNPGYDVTINERVVKRILNKIRQNPNRMIESDFEESVEGNRRRVVWFAPAAEQQIAA